MNLESTDKYFLSKESKFGRGNYGLFLVTPPPTKLGDYKALDEWCNPTPLVIVSLKDLRLVTIDDDLDESINRLKGRHCSRSSLIISTESVNKLIKSSKESL